jgi:uncharacterized protein (TIGR02421 family)
MKQSLPAVSEKLIDTICARLDEGKEVIRALPGWGRIHIDRPLPFLCLYRLPPGRSDAGTKKLVYGEASYIIAAGDEAYHEGLSRLLLRIAESMRERFGAFLLIEIWSLPKEEGEAETPIPLKPGFTIFSPGLGLLTPTIEVFRDRLSEISANRRRADVELVYSTTVAPLGLVPVLPLALQEKMGCYTVGLGVKPIYQDAQGESVYPFELGRLHRGIAKTLKKAFFAFATRQTSIEPKNFMVLGRRSVKKVVWEIDNALAAVDDSFDFLLQVTPVNTNEAWESFKESGYKQMPHFHYRPRPFDPSIMKRRLHAIPVEKIEDPTLLHLFREKRDELDRKLTMLYDRDTHNFLHGSIQTYGGVSPSLLETAQQLLKLMPSRDEENIGPDADTGTVTAEEFAHRAEAEIAYYKEIYPSIDAKVELREDIVSGAMVSGENFLISKWAHFPQDRIEALLHHEIGTHVLTYVNGRSQPFQQLHTGLSGYDEMQEGIAVLSEYLCGGLSKARLRILAGRVVAAKCLIDGESFIETYTTLCEECGFMPKTAFTVTTRIFRGGGLTKDAVYLRGLIGVLEYIAKGGALEPLFVGKLAASHIPIVEELQWRQILNKPPLCPRYMQTPDAKKRLDEIRNKGLGVVELAKRSMR